MKEDNERKRKSNTRTIVNKKLLNYSIAAGAAVAMTQPAQAAVVITDPPDITIDGDNKFQKIDINGDAVFDFVFGFINNDLVIDDIANNNNLVFKYGYNDPFDDYALKFLCDEWINWDAAYYQNAFLLYDDGGGISGPFAGDSGYIGVRFYIPAGVETGYHFGWIEFEGDKDGKWGKIKRWAYETDVETTILTPPCEEEIIPTLNQWGMMILMGLILLEGGRRLKRRKDQEV